MLIELLKNCRTPASTKSGFFMLKRMKKEHAPLSRWGMSFLRPRIKDVVLDIGCGGGESLARLHQLTPLSQSYGIDLSPASVSVAQSVNRNAVRAGKIIITEGNVSSLPFEDQRFNIITAFETVYFWPDLSGNIKEVVRCLKPGGTFLTCLASDNIFFMWPFMKTIGFPLVCREELVEYFECAGLQKVIAHSHGRWVAVTGQK